MDTKIDFFHDIRREKRDNSYPVKLRVYDAVTKKTKLYSIGIDLKKEEFCANLTDFTKKLLKKGENDTFKHDNAKDIRILLQKIYNKAHDIASHMERFTFQVFEKKMFSGLGEGKDILSQIQHRIDLIISSTPPPCIPTVEGLS
jgi:hypothetical protein